MTDEADEFDLISRLWAPLSLGAPGSFGLKDDVAQLPAHLTGVVVTLDQVIEGTHFLSTDPLDWVARRLVRRNASDLIAKGTRPVAAFLSLAWPHTRSRQEMALFAKGLGSDLSDLCEGCPLMGGDTSTTLGPLIASLTMMGQSIREDGAPVLRSGAQPFDHLVVAGTFGDAALGLQVRLGHMSADGLEPAVAIALAPAPPPLAFADLIARFAHASIDVSDGLLADAAHLGAASGLKVSLDLDQMPLSETAQTWVDAQPDRRAALTSLATGGDDYQPVMAIPPPQVEAAKAAARQIGVRLTEIGRLEPGTGFFVLDQGLEIELPDRLGWQIKAG